jgi:5-methylcytosine-specific restriction endonuclease McrA
MSRRGEAMVSKLNQPRETKVSPAVRFAVYARDSWVCLYCARGAEDGISLTVDHVQPVATGGTDAASNLVTCCGDCNSLKRDMSLTGWALYLRERGLKTAAMVRRVKAQLQKPVDLAAGKAAAKARKG